MKGNLNEITRCRNLNQIPGVSLMYTEVRACDLVSNKILLLFSSLLQPANNGGVVDPCTVQAFLETANLKCLPDLTAGFLGHDM
jgi:hypothetical protein